MSLIVQHSLHPNQSWAFHPPSTSSIAPKRGQYRGMVYLLPQDLISGGDSWHCSSILLLRGKGTEPGSLMRVLRMKQPTQEATLLLSLLLWDTIHLLFVPVWMGLLAAKRCTNYGSKMSIHEPNTQLIESRLNFILNLDSLDWMKTDLRTLPGIWFELTKNGKLIPVRWRSSRTIMGH